MKKISTIVLGISLLASSAVYAANNGMNESQMKNMTHGTMSSKSMGAYHNQMMVEGYHVTFSSMKPLVDGKNHMSVKLEKDGKVVKDADVKIKFSMPIMPGMEFSENAKADGDNYNCMVEFSMQGEWAYELEFKTRDGKMHMAKGSVNP